MDNKRDKNREFAEAYGGGRVEIRSVDHSSVRDKNAEFLEAYGGTVTQRTSRIVVSARQPRGLGGSAMLLRALLEADGYRGPKADPVPRGVNRTGRNQACPCGSGKKFKKCCGVAK